MKYFIGSTSILALLFFSGFAYADCQCVCLDGEVRALCTSSLDIEPICAPRICPITPPSIAPIEPPRIPPIGTTNCVQKQVYNEYTHQYEWQEVCF